MYEFKESDWKILRQLHPVVLERFCKQILTEVKDITSRGVKGYHKKYLDLWEFLRCRDKEMSRAFDDMRRSRALTRIASMKELGLLTDEEFSRFSQETRRAVELMLES